MRPKSMILIVVALGCGLIASIGISQVLESRSAEPVVVPTEKIYVAIKDVPLGNVLNAQMVRMEEWPKDKVPEGAVKSLDRIEGRRPLTRLYPGEPILAAKLIDANKFYGPSDKIPKGMRVVSVKVNSASSASGLLNPGDRVDVLVYLKKGKGIRYTTTRTILKNITVFAVNTVTNREIDENGSVIHAKTVSLLVHPPQVEKIMLANELGKIKLSMRRSDDDLEDNAKGATIADLDVGSSGDGESKPRTASNDDSGGITDFLRGMTTMDDSTADTTSKWVMHIHSPKDIKVYNWDDPASLPRELVDSEAVSPDAFPEMPDWVDDTADSNNSSSTGPTKDTSTTEVSSGEAIDSTERVIPQQ